MTEGGSRPVVVLGSLNIDLITRVERLPEPGETLAGSDIQLLRGGKGANQALAAARAGASVHLIGRVGDDTEGRDYRSALAGQGIDVSGVTVVGGTATGQALITVAAGGENTIVVVAGANRLLAVSDLEVPVLAGPVVLLTQFEVPVDVVAAAAVAVTGRGGRVVVNPSPVRPVPPELLSRADPIVVNEREADALGGSAALLAAGAPSVVVTLGARGAWFRSGGDEGVVSAPAVTALDSTGAGDVFAGTLAAALAGDLDLPAAVRISVEQATLATLWMGAQP